MICINKTPRRNKRKRKEAMGDSNSEDETSQVGESSKQQEGRKKVQKSSKKV